jgi:hypothetical protein
MTIRFRSCRGYQKPHAAYFTGFFLPLRSPPRSLPCTLTGEEDPLEFSSLIVTDLQAEFSKNGSNPSMFKHKKDLRCGLNGLDAAVESFGRSVADG